jgi:hypothetical protein
MNERGRSVVCLRERNENNALRALEHLTSAHKSLLLIFTHTQQCCSVVSFSYQMKKEPQKLYVCERWSFAKACKSNNIMIKGWIASINTNRRANEWMNERTKKYISSRHYLAPHCSPLLLLFPFYVALLITSHAHFRRKRNVNMKQFEVKQTNLSVW